MGWGLGTPAAILYPKSWLVSSYTPMHYHICIIYQPTTYIYMHDMFFLLSIWGFNFLYPQLVRTYYGMVWMSVHPSVWASVCLSVGLYIKLVNIIQTEPFQLAPFNLEQVLLMTRGRHLLIFKVRGQRSRSHTRHCWKTL